ncbi:LysR substrate-binding domain-containing protein [Cupriavidus necator]
MSTDAAHPLQRQKKLSLSKLVGQEWVLPPPHVLLRQQIEAAFKVQELPAPKLCVESNFNRPAMLQLVLGSERVSICGPDTLARMKDLRALDIRTEELDLSRRIGIMYRTSAYLTPLVRRLVEIIEEQCQRR